MAELAVYDNDPTIYLFTSLTAGSSHIITATSRIETILKANKIPFKGVDTATDELARKLFQRRARGKKLPLLVKEGFVIADLDQVEEWNEYDELKEALGAPAAPAPPVAVPLIANKTPASASAAVGAPPASGKENASDAPKQTPEQNLAIRQLGAQAASVAAAKKQAPTKISTTNPLLAAKASASPSASAKPEDKVEDGGVLSPKSIPLPGTPADAKGEKNPLSPKEETKQVVAEESGSSSEEESEEEEDDDEEDDEEDEDEEEEEEEEKEKVTTKTEAKDTTATKGDDKEKEKENPKTQAQDPKDASKAGVSVQD